MKYRYLGRSGLLVSRLCLGTMTFGNKDWGCDQEVSSGIVRTFVEGGGNFIDTADGYSGGESEKMLGVALKDYNRDALVIATKCWFPAGKGVTQRGLSRKHIVEAAEASLKRLGTDYIDLYQFHHIDRDTPWDEIWQAMEVAVQQGKILYAGSSNFAGWHIAKAQGVAKARNFVGLVSEQSIYNLIERTVELEVLPACRDFGLGVIPWSPLHGGLLGGVIRKESEGRRRLEGRSAETLNRLRPQIEQYEAFCGELGQQPGDVALAWLLHQPAVTGPIIGPRTREQLDAAERASELKLDDSALKRLDEIFPGHKTAPEDYAW